MPEDQIQAKSYKSEAELQAVFWKHTWNTYPQLNDHMWSVPNDAIGQVVSMKDILRMNELIATGMLSGVWDLHCFWFGVLHIIESKLPGNTLTTTRMVKVKGSNPPRYRKVRGQKEWGEKMAAHGAVRHIYHSLEEGIAIIETILQTGS